MAMSSIGQPVVITPSNMRRFAEVASKPKPIVKVDKPLEVTLRPGKPGKKGTSQ